MLLSLRLLDIVNRYAKTVYASHKELCNPAIPVNGHHTAYELSHINFK